MPTPEISDLFAILFILLLILTSGKLVSLGQAIGRGLDGNDDQKPPPTDRAGGPSAG